MEVPMPSTPTAGTAFGIDIGGSGIKGAPVDLATGEFSAERLRIPTPKKSTPRAVAETCAEVLAGFDLAPEVPIGLTFPAPIKHGVVPFIANLDQSWKGVNVPELMTETIGRTVIAVNDADAAGYAETVYGAAKGVDGVVLVVTLGTGIGSALIVDGTLVPNTELGHLEIDGHDAESRAADSAREREDLSWEKWVKRLQTYFSHVEMLFSPDLIVVGGGVSKKHEHFLPLLDLQAPIVPATLRNSAGIVGAAALAAAQYR
jgi:polyphosphate glucokinase